MKSLSSVLALAVAGLSAPGCRRTPQDAPPRRHARHGEDLAVPGGKDYFDQTVRTNRAEWVYQTNITYDTAELTSAGNAALTKLQVDQAKQAAICQGAGPCARRRAQAAGHPHPDHHARPDHARCGREFAAPQARVQGIYGRAMAR
jgi:peptidyl-dipeptidase A